MEDCSTCCNYQPFFVRNEGKFFITTYGFCCIKSICKTKGFPCSDYNKKPENEKILTPTKDNIATAVNNLLQILENMGIIVDDKEVGRCKPRKCYNSKLE